MRTLIEKLDPEIVTEVRRQLDFAEIFLFAAFRRWLDSLDVRVAQSTVRSCCRRLKNFQVVALLIYRPTEASAS